MVCSLYVIVILPGTDVPVGQNSGRFDMEANFTRDLVAANHIA